MRHERVDEKSARHARQRVAQQARCGDDAAAVSHDEVRVTCDLCDVLVLTREHHELGVRGDDEGALASLEAAKDPLRRPSKVDAVEAHAEHVDPRGHDLT
jgi:hypothetical protein